MKINEIIFGLFFLIATSAFSQKNQFQVLNNHKTIGKSLIDNSEIDGIEYVFSDRIHQIFLDTTTSILTVQLRGLSNNRKWLNNTGQIVQYDIKNQKVLWNKKIAYQVSDLLQFDKTILLTKGNKSYCLDIYTGNERWEVKNDIYHVNPINNIGVGYKFKTLAGYTNQLEGIFLTTGDAIWKRELNREYGWNNLFYTNDSTMIVVAAGLHSININTGKGWDYYTITGKKDYSVAIATTAVSAALGLLTGTYIMSTGYNLVRDLTSNTWVDSSSIFFASSEQLAKIEKESGVLMWKAPFPKDLASKSSIFIKDSLIYMVNKGMAYMGYKRINYGMPFFAAFNKQTGKQIFFSTINSKEDPILSFEANNKEIILVFKNRISKYSMKTGAEILEQEFQNDTVGELKVLVGSRIFKKSENGELSNLRQSDTSNVFVSTSRDKTLSLDNNLNVTQTFDNKDLSIFYEQTSQYNFLAKEKNTLIVNNEGKKIAEIEATSKSFLIDRTLYSTQDNKLIVIDLSKILTNE